MPYSEQILKCDNPEIISLSIEFQMGLDAIGKTKNYKLKEMIELSKELAYIYNSSNDYLKNEELSSKQLDDFILNKGEFPSRENCERLFKELFMHIGTFIRRVHGITKDIIGIDFKLSNYVEKFSDLFGINSYEHQVMLKNNDILKLLYDIRGEIEHPKNLYEYNWFKLDELNSIHEHPLIRFKNNYYSSSQLAKDSINFLVFHASFMIASQLIIDSLKNKIDFGGIFNGLIKMNYDELGT